MSEPNQQASTSGVTWPAGVANGAYTPQGVDIGEIIKVVLPQILPHILAAQPQFNPQGFSFGVKTPFGGGGLSVNSAQPTLAVQGINLGDIIKTVVPIVLSTLSAGPRLQSAGVVPQGIDLGDIVRTVLPIVLSTLSAGPRLQSAGVVPQGIDLGDIIKAVVPIVLSTLSANPQVSPQGFSFGVSTPIGGVGINLSSAQPTLQPQSVDLGQIVSAVVPIITQLVPVIINLLHGGRSN